MRWSRQPRSLNHRRLLYCIRWFQKTRTEWVFFLSSSEKKKSTDSLTGGLRGLGGVLANRIQLLYYKQRSEGSRKTGARTTLREKMLCYGAFSSLDSHGKLVGVGHETLSRLSHERKHLGCKNVEKQTSQKRNKSFTD